MASITGAILVLAGVIGMSFGDKRIGEIIFLVGALYLIVGIANRYMHFVAKTPKD
ncbi:MAG: hypothetical protein IH984_04755 [Planctomycetes bacterium]|nr:hypothetical protein [Planctomycetota bacterium]